MTKLKKQMINDNYHIGEKLFEFSRTKDLIDCLQDLLDQGYEDFSASLELEDYSSGELYCMVSQYRGETDQEFQDRTKEYREHVKRCKQAEVERLERNRIHDEWERDRDIKKINELRSKHGLE